MKFFQDFVLENKNQIIIAGGGHAGVEAALALDRMGLLCTIVTMDKRALGRLSCNPAIGGLGKSHLVKEIDALGGLMGWASDLSHLQSKILNKTKGRAVWALRQQVDKKIYPTIVNNLIKKSKNIKVVEDEVVAFTTNNNKINSAVLKSLGKIKCEYLIVTSGTFLNGLIHVGNKNYKAGRMGEKPSFGLSECLKEHGFTIGRLKTGTPPRIERNSIDWSKTKIAKGDKETPPFSLITQRPFSPNKENCFLVNTNEVVHNVINKNISSSPMFSGKIKGVGPRYCPSIEDKIYRFKERNSHHLFIEPEWSKSSQMYVSGFSTSLPERTQKEALRSIDALRNVKFRRPGYAIEYDYSPPYQLKETLESKNIAGLFLAGQINGTSGYEEAAAQGLVAGANAGLKLKNEKALILQRTNSYIGVMINDLVTSHLMEPYRMFTSRAEHRLYLRSDNAYTRLSDLAKSKNLLTENHLSKLNKYIETTENINNWCEKSKISLDNQTVAVKKYIKRPSASLNKTIDKNISKGLFFSESLFEVETNIKYEGYIQNELDRMHKINRSFNIKIPKNIKYSSIPGLSTESKERLALVCPENILQASQVDGIRPTDVFALTVFIERRVSRET